MTATFEANADGLLELLNASEARAHVTDVARRAAEEAERIASGQRTPPHYPQSIGSTEAQATPQGARAVVYSDSSFWHWTEFGSINFRPLRPLTSGVIAVGVDFQAEPKP